MLSSESITMSVFVLAGPELRATIEFHGPLPSDNPIDSGSALHAATLKWDPDLHGEKGLNFYENVDFEHLNIGDEDIEEPINIDEPDDKDGETVDEKRERRAQARKKVLEERDRREARKRKQRSKVRDEGEPFLKTLNAPSSGWYRFCIVGTWNQITAEIDLRKESEFGGKDEDGHVWTMQEKTLNEEEKLIEEDTAVSEGIKDEDFESTKEKLKTLRRLLADIQSKQSQERHRLIVHAATNEHSHSRMVLGSLLETVLFMVVTGFQVYTIRRWFKSAPVLGR